MSNDHWISWKNRKQTIISNKKHSSAFCYQSNGFAEAKTPIAFYELYDKQEKLFTNQLPLLSKPLIHFVATCWALRTTFLCCQGNSEFNGHNDTYNCSLLSTARKVIIRSAMNWTKKLVNYTDWSCWGHFEFAIQFQVQLYWRFPKNSIIDEI